jgi:hypothetical protein
MRYLLLSSVFILGLSPLASHAQEPDLAKKMELAQEYSKLVPVDTEINKTIEQLSLQVPVAQRVLFKSILQTNIKADRLRTASELALTEIFTEDELAALVAFYRTSAGQSIKDKMPEYQSRLQPVLQEMVQDSMQALQKQMIENNQ